VAVVSAAGTSPDLAGKAAGGRRLIAVVYADMAGYSRLIGLDDAGTLRRLRTLRRALIDPAIREHGGRVVQTGGDSLLAVFDSIEGAVRCTVKVQQQVPVYDGDQPLERRIRFRVGINIGDVIPHGTDVHGDAVNIAARLQAECPIGGICVSRPVRDHVHDRFNLAFEPMGELALKNIARPVEAFVLHLDPTTEASPPSRPVVMQGVASPDVKLSGAPRLSLVVLPFENLGDSIEEYTVDGIAGDLTTDLSRIPGFLVVARSSAFTYKGKPIDIKRAGAELGVRYAVEGSVRMVGGTLRVNVQLSSTETGMLLWADRFDLERDGTRSSLDDIVRQIGITLNARLLEIESARSARERPAQPDAADVLLQARALNSLPTNFQVLAQKMALYERAVELDPASTRALVGLAEALVDSISLWAEDPSSTPKFRRAEELIRRAELLRPDDANVMWVRVHLLGRQGRYSEVIPAAQRAIDAYPKMSGSHFWLGICLMHAGRPADAIHEYELSLRLHPRSPHAHNRYRNIGYALIFLGKYDEAIPWFQRSLAVHPTQSPETRGYTRAAIAAAQALVSRRRGTPERSRSHSDLAHAYRARLLPTQHNQSNLCRTGRTHARRVTPRRYS
jgi:adenylate cyclase